MGLENNCGQLCPVAIVEQTPVTVLPPQTFCIIVSGTMPILPSVCSI